MSFHHDSTSILPGLCFIPSRLLCSLRCDKHVSQNTSPQVTTCNEVCEEHQLCFGHSSSCLWQLIHQKLCIAQQIHGEGTRQYFSPGFANIFANAGIPAVIWHLTIRSRTTSESHNTLTYRQYDSRLGVSPGEVGDPTGRPADSLGGSAVAGIIHS